MMHSIFPQRPSDVPTRGTPFSRKIFQKLFSCTGWSIQGEIPNAPKAVAIFAPHTSNMDGWHAFLAILGLGIKVHVFGKHTLFKPPFRHLLNWVGIMPVDRRSLHGLTQQIIQSITQHEKIWVGIAPEGTRLNAEKFKSGFYHIALGANIPIIMFSIDYEKQILYCLGQFLPTHDYEHDFASILQHYHNHFSPKHPERLSKPLQKQ